MALYKTAFDAITLGRHLVGPPALPPWKKKSLSGLSGIYEDALASYVQTGINSSGVSYILINGTPFTDLNSLKNGYAGWTASGASNIVLDRAWGVVMSVLTMYPGAKTVADVIGYLRQNYPTTYFSAYAPPPAPTIVAPSTTTAAPPPPPPAPPPVIVPPGFITMPATWAPRSGAWPVYGLPPRHVKYLSGGVSVGSPYWTFAGVTPFYGTAAKLSPDQTFPTMGLDPQKLSLGIYSVRETDLGPLVSESGRTYELFQVDIFDGAAGVAVGDFWYTTEGGGGGLLISDPLELASRIIVDVSTMGQAELARAGAQAAGVSEKNIALAEEAGAALAIAIATVGVGEALAAPAVGAESTLTAGATEVTLLSPTVEAGAAVSGVGGAATDAVAVTVAGTTASSGAGAALTTVGAVAAKTLGAAALSVGTGALSTEIKKLTGQLPPKPSYNLVQPTQAAEVPPAPSASPWLLAAGLAALAFFSKRG